MSANPPADTAAALMIEVEAGERRASMANLLSKWAAASNAARTSGYHFPADCLAEAVEVTRQLHEQVLAAADRDTASECPCASIPYLDQPPETRGGGQ